MRVLVTGGTGFVGAHCVRALRDDGHEVVVLARDPQRVPTALEPLEVAADDVVVGDVRDDTAVERALSDVEAVLHAANVYSFHPAAERTLEEVNVDGTRRILHAAVARGLDPVVHVSSTVALLPSDHLTSASPVGEPDGAYARTKAAAESIANDLQEQGAPVVITNPAAVIGPHDPHVGDTTAPFRDMVRGKLRTVYRAGVGLVDVRDLATAHARLFTPGRGPRRYLMAGHWVGIPEMFRLLARVLERRLPRMWMPTGAVVAAARLADAARRRGIDPGFSSELVWVQRHHPRFDDRDTQRELGVAWRPTTDSLRDMVAWLHEQGRLSARQAGAAAGAGWTAGVPSGVKARWVA